MPVFDQDAQDKITLLRGLRALGTAIEVYELLKVEWPAPDGTIYYASTDVAAVASIAPSVSPIHVRLIPDGQPNWFLSFDIDSSIGDEDVELKFWDQDDVISDLIFTHGEGVRTEILYWFPQVDLLLPQWQGHLRAEDEGDAETITLKAVQGFRSSEASCPSRAHYSYCQAIFGGVLTTQAEIDEQGCPYNLHLGGAIGTNDPDTGLPWTFCPRRSTGNCTERGVDELRHLSHATMVKTIVNVQSSGARLLSTSIGNETNLTEPVVVVMGTRRKHDMKVMAFRRDVNTNTPDHGWFQGLYEAVEGPIASITQARITVAGVEQNAVPLHYGARLGNFGDAPTDVSLTTHGYSATAYIRYAFGWVDPTAVDPEDASASALISGLRDIRVYGSVAASDNGLLASFYTDTTFTSSFGQQIIPACNYLMSWLPPVEGMPGESFSFRLTGKIKPRYSETYTFTGEFDDKMKLIVNGSTIFNGTVYTDSPLTGTIALTADVEYDIVVEFVQGPGSPQWNPWKCILSWNSTSQTLEVVPNSRLFVGVDDDLVIKTPTSNRVWQIARILCDKRWGNGYDYDKLGIASWIESAAWVADFVRFTDVDGTIWDHQRGMSDVELIERKIQQQVEDMCMAGRLSMPFLFNGEMHIQPLRALTEDELTACPEFTDEGDTGRNIIQEEVEDGVFKSTLTFSRKSDLDLPNRIECTYDAAVEDYKKTPLQPVEDIDAQLRAGRIVGDKSRKINPKKYHLLGVTGEGHAMKLQWALMDLGPHDEGGLRNNLEIKFKIWFVDALDLHIAKVIKVTSSRITKYGFTHFRIKGMQRADNLHYEVIAQAYNHDYMTAFEVLLSDLPSPPETPGPPEPPGPEPPQCILTFGDISYVDGVLEIPIPQCVVALPGALEFLTTGVEFGGASVEFNP